MTKKFTFARQYAMTQVFRWSEVLKSIEHKIENGDDPSIDEVLAAHEKLWRKWYAKSNAGLKRKPKYLPTHLL